MMDIDNSWYAYQCHSGEVLFYFNSSTGEHKWAVHFCGCLKSKSSNSQPKPCCTWQPIKAKTSESGKFVRSIATETEDCYFTDNHDNKPCTVSLVKRKKFLHNEGRQRSDHKIKETQEHLTQDNTNNDGDKSQIYSTESIGPVEVVLDDPFLHESEKSLVFPKRLTLKLADSASHGLSVTQYAASSNKKTRNDYHSDNTYDSSMSAEEGSENVSEPTPHVLQMKENIFASLKRELPSFCVDDDMHGGVRLKKAKLASTSSRKNPEPRKFERAKNAAVSNDTGMEEEDEDEVEEEGELDEENVEEYKKAYLQNPMFKVDLNNPLPSTSTTQTEDNNSEEPLSTICPLCNQDCHNPTDLTNHIMYHQPSGTTCPVCQKVFSRRQGLRYHVQTHSGDKPHMCKLCNKTFTKAASLVAHVRMHYGIKPFRCPKCNKEFTHSGNLSSHLRIHSALRPYRCKFCTKGFKTSSHLSLHLKSHSDARPYKCSECGKAFKNSSHLRSHQKVHSVEKNVICGSCNEGFKTFADLMSHQRSNSLCHGMAQQLETSREHQRSFPSQTVTSEQSVERDGNVQRDGIDNIDVLPMDDVTVQVVET